MLILYLLYHIQLRVMWELICPASQLLQLHLQSFSLSEQLLLASLLGGHQHLKKDRTF